MKYEAPSVKDLGSIAEHTFYRCSIGNPDSNKPKNDQDLQGLDKFGECSHS